MESNSVISLEQASCESSSEIVDSNTDSNNINSSEENIIEVHESLGWPFNWINWCQTSQTALRDAENSILASLSYPYETQYLNIGPVIDEKDVFVWTWSANKTNNEIPLVLIHGLGSGLALWTMNLDKLSQSAFPVFAIDLPGFGRSSRPTYNEDPLEAEKQFVEIIEAWRSQMGLEKMVLVGHSFGGFLSFSYSLHYPKRVAHLICAEPWGFNKKPDNLSDITRIPIHHRMIVKTMDFLQWNPLWAIRFLGPLGPSLIEKVRADLIENFSAYMVGAQQKISQYIFHCNAQNPTGETAFKTMMSDLGWAKNPMYFRLDSLDENVPLTLIYGSKSWVDHLDHLEVARRRHPAFVDYHIIESGHHVYAAYPEIFNGILLKAANEAEALKISKS